ncbi:MAG TPA: hypothetical protein VGR14_01800 [Verrucomicrobiae bacterium]|jgi:hypothetical protein|nr:hypothetical protein [Verrucomicrobiae bacterium]
MRTFESKNNFATRQNRIRPALMSVMLGLAAMLALAGGLRAGNVYVPNNSFESPDIGTNSPYAAPVLDDWQESPQPIWYNPADFGGSPWEDLFGTFYNLPDFTNSMGTNNLYIDNCDGVQAAFLFALPQVAIYQDLDATFMVGNSYTLTVGMIGGGGGMTNGSTFELSLYYLDASNNMVTVAETTVTNTTANFPTETHFVDFQVQLPDVQATDPWAGQNIGIQLLATPDFNNPASWGGFWDVDNVRLVEGIYVPNNSFELPDIGTNSPYAAPVLDDWEESPQPIWYVPSEFGGSPWEDLFGTFYNLPDFTNSMGTNNTYIDNCDGVQAAFLFALPQVAIFQDLEATFAVGKSYTLTVALIGGGGGMTNGSTFELSLYYLDGSSNMDIVAATTVTNTIANFRNQTHFVDFQLQVPGVQPADPWAGQQIGIQLLATPDFNNPDSWGGFWDVDNVRLSETSALNLVNPTVTNGQLQLSVQSEPGAVLQILATTDLTIPVTNWTNLATFTNTTGSTPFVDTSAALGQRFYTARPSP